MTGREWEGDVFCLHWGMNPGLYVLDFQTNHLCLCVMVNCATEMSSKWCVFGVNVFGENINNMMRYSISQVIFHKLQMLDILTENMHEHGGGGGSNLSHALLANYVCRDIMQLCKETTLLTNHVCRYLVGGVFLRTVPRTMLSTGAIK